MLLFWRVDFIDTLKPAQKARAFWVYAIPLCNRLNSGIRRGWAGVSPAAQLRKQKTAYGFPYTACKTELFHFMHAPEIFLPFHTKLPVENNKFTRQSCNHDGIQFVNDLFCLPRFRMCSIIASSQGENFRVWYLSYLREPFRCSLRRMAAALLLFSRILYSILFPLSIHFIFSSFYPLDWFRV